ncbi:hypothetical protein AS593_15910 [Caulobacter vibrioides]|nr:hypothetical protein AS593_15910 [Caulobacter vibrioides]
MKSWLIAAAATVVAAGLAGAAQAGTPYPIKMKCAVGGESFTHTGTASYSTWGQRPDGKPYGSWEFPMPLPVCPGNGLVMYRDFTKPELKQLPALLASEAYKALADDASYYRAAWLERSLKGEADPLWLVLQASWQVDDDPIRKARYQREFAQAVEAEPARPGDAGWMGKQGRAANARRELGQFDAAKADLARLEIDKLVAALPAPPSDGVGEPEDVAARRGVLGYLGRLRDVVNRGDASSEPIDMVPPMVAANQCLDLEAKGQAPEICKIERVAKSMEMVRKARAERAGAGS